MGRFRCSPRSPPTITSIISTLPVSALRSLVIRVDPCGLHWADFKEPFSSLVERCGPSLTEFASPARLSDAAINHLIQLPHLHAWFTGDPPPNFPPSSSRLVFPALVQLTLWDGATSGWLSLFRRLERDVPATEGITPLSRIRDSLRVLNIRNLKDFAIDTSVTSPIQIFRNMISLNVATRCRGGDDDSQCSFKLNNGDAAQLAAALPQLESLFLGHPCSNDTCATTVACLLPISTYCVKLRNLEIHFNAINIIDDLRGISEDPRSEKLRSLPRRKLSCLYVYRIPLTLDESGLETVARGMIDVFPSLRSFSGLNDVWGEISGRVVKLQGA